ncbi:MAG TPA: DUF4259 domain-containing protein [Actinomycetes bacterium]|nr:DUF4259 domain-containing protein [Actinomycetes bacterium]
MAMWGSGPFDCDEALDWFADLEQTPSTELPGALAAALHPGEAETDQRVALAAAVLVAHGCARAVRAGAPEVDEWLGGHRPTVSRQLADEALLVVDAAIDAGVVPGSVPWLSGVRRALEAGSAREQVTPIRPDDSPS